MFGVYFGPDAEEKAAQASTMLEDVANEIEEHVKDLPDKEPETKQERLNRMKQELEEEVKQ